MDFDWRPLALKVYLALRQEDILFSPRAWIELKDVMTVQNLGDSGMSIVSLVVNTTFWKMQSQCFELSQFGLACTCSLGSVAWL